MSNVVHTVDQLVAAVGSTYRAIDMRSVAIRNIGDDSWSNVLAAIRFTYEDVDSAKARLVKLSQRFPAVQTNVLRIDSYVRPFIEWSDLRSELTMKGILKLGELEFHLRQRPNFGQPGYIRCGYSRLRPFDGHSWPEMAFDFDIGGNHPLIEGQFSREAHLLGYSDAFAASNALCETNVSLQQDRGCDLSISFPIFTDISAIQIEAPEKRINVEVRCHRDFSDIKTFACVRGQSKLVDAPFREQIPLSEVALDESKSEIVSALGSVRIEDLDVDNDWLEIRLVHPMLGEVKKDSNYARMFVSPVERNILLEAVVQTFCKGKTLHELLAEAYNVQPKKLRPSAAFELHVSWLLGMFGLSTVVLGEYEHILAPDTKHERASIDILAASQRSRLLLLVSCTLNPPKPEDVSNLRYAREILDRGVFAGTGVRIIPILFTSSMGGPAYYQSEDHFDSVPVVDSDGVKVLLDLLKSGQERRFFEFLGNPSMGLEAYAQPR